MKFNRNILLLVIVCIAALNLASKPNSDNPEIKPFGFENKPVPVPVPIIPTPPPEVPTTKSGYKNFTRSCSVSTFTFNTSSYKLTGKCNNYNRQLKSSTLDLGDCFNSDGNNRLEKRGTWGNYLKTDCGKNCTVNLKTMFLTCTCAGNVTSMNLNINISNSNGKLKC